MENRISVEETKKIAQLTNLSLTDEEVNKLSGMFTDTLEYISVLNELDVAGISETYQVTGLENVFFENGENVATLAQEEALKNADEVIDSKFVTGAVFDR